MQQQSLIEKPKENKGDVFDVNEIQNIIATNRGGRYRNTGGNLPTGGKSPKKKNTRKWTLF